MTARSIVTFALLACGVSGYAAASTWSDLWSTREQQGQQLLDANHPAEAAQLFSDPKRRAYAELQAGKYDKAADLLAPLKDADSQYNRGNALAHTGKLRDALSAYDAALASSPGNKDVMRNRDLVARALESQQHQQQGKNGSSGKNGQGQPNGGGQGSGGAGDKQQGGKDSGSQSQDGKSGQAGDQAGQQDPSSKQGQSGQQDQSGKPGQEGTQGQASAQNQAADQSKGANQAQSGQQGQGNQQAAGAAANKPGQQDPRNATALQAGQTSGTGTRQGPPNMSESPLVKGSAAVDSSKAQTPRSEQALALDQWLRGIPEDSGELLRRKFLIEHMLRQQGKEQ